MITAVWYRGFSRNSSGVIRNTTINNTSTSCRSPGYTFLVTYYFLLLLLFLLLFLVLVLVHTYILRIYWYIYISASFFFSATFWNTSYFYRSKINASYTSPVLWDHRFTRQNKIVFMPDQAIPSHPHNIPYLAKPFTIPHHTVPYPCHPASTVIEDSASQRLTRQPTSPQDVNPTGPRTEN